MNDLMEYTGDGDAEQYDFGKTGLLLARFMSSPVKAAKASQRSFAILRHGRQPAARGRMASWSVKSEASSFWLRRML